MGCKNEWIKARGMRISRKDTNTFIVAGEYCKLKKIFQLTDWGSE
jgi:hypothetical protein